MRTFAAWAACLALGVLFPALALGQRAVSSAGAVPGVQRAGRVGSPVQWRITESPREPVRPGLEFAVSVQATVATGWHLYALDEPEDGPVPLEFDAPPEGPVTLVSVGADRPQRETAAGSAAAVNFYQGQPRFRLRLRAGSGLKAGAGPVVLEIRYQACNERLCLPPRTATLFFPLRSRP